MLTSLQREADLQTDLPVRDLAVDDMAARLGDGEPVHVADRLVGLGDRCLHGILDADRRRAGEFQELVDVVGHDGDLLHARDRSRVAFSLPAAPRLHNAPDGTELPEPLGSLRAAHARTNEGPWMTPQPLRLHVPEPSGRPGQHTDFSYLLVSESG